LERCNEHCLTSTTRKFILLTKNGDIHMNTIAKKFVAFLKDEEGLTTVEYAVAGTLIALVVVAAFTRLGTEVGGAVNQIGDVISNARP